VILPGDTEIDEVSVAPVLVCRTALVAKVPDHAETDIYPTLLELHEQVNVCEELVVGA
jgi:hypothetical protein